MTANFICFFSPLSLGYKGDLTEVITVKLFGKSCLCSGGMERHTDIVSFMLLLTGYKKIKIKTSNQDFGSHAETFQGKKDKGTY